eukprot:SAG22_NODE_6950_length_791_cov_1.982659_2_plen_65_part_00
MAMDGAGPDFRARVQYTFEQMDRSGSGSVSFMELLKWWKNEVIRRHASPTPPHRKIGLLPTPAC